MTYFATTLGLLVLGCASWAAELAPAKPLPDVIHVVCHGRLLENVMAIGGDTTGTTITFDGMTWDLKLNNAIRKQLAASEHRQVKVTGRLHLVKGVARSYYMIDVEQLTKWEKDPKSPKPKAEFTLTGTLAPMTNRMLPESILVAGEAWPVTWGADTTLQSQAAALAGKTIIAKGTAEANTEGGPKRYPIFHIEQVKAE